MDKAPNQKQYDLEERTQRFAIETRRFVLSLPKNVANLQDGRQLIRSSGSVGANYIEANEALSKKDFLMRAKICRKEAKESVYWLGLLILENPDLNKERERLLQEATEIMKIFGSIVSKSS